jgi:hypothetical protein
MFPYTSPRDIWAKVSSSEEYDCLGCNVMQFSNSPPTFRRNEWPPTAGSKSKPSEISNKQALVSCLAYTWNLKMEAISSSETSVDFYLTAQRCNPEDHTINSHHCDNFRYRILSLLFKIAFWKQRTETYIRLQGKSNLVSSGTDNSNLSNE